MRKKSTGWVFQPLRPRALERTTADRTDGPDAGLPSLSGRPRLAGSSLSRLSLRLTKEETSCGSGSIFRVRRCNKKQSSQRGVDRRWHGRPRRARRIGDRLSALSRDARFFIYSIAAFRILSLLSRFVRLVLVSASCQLASFFACFLCTRFIMQSFI